jgi:hypothetical protein
MAGKPRQLFTWLGKSDRPVQTIRAPAIDNPMNTSRRGFFFSAQGALLHCLQIYGLSSPISSFFLIIILYRAGLISPSSWNSEQTSPHSLHPLHLFLSITIFLSGNIIPSSFLIENNIQLSRLIVVLIITHFLLLAEQLLPLCSAFSNFIL